MIPLRCTKSRFCGSDAPRAVLLAYVRFPGVVPRLARVAVLRAVSEFARRRGYPRRICILPCAGQAGPLTLRHLLDEVRCRRVDAVLLIGVPRPAASAVLRLSATRLVAVTHARGQ